MTKERKTQIMYVERLLYYLSTRTGVHLVPTDARLLMHKQDISEAMTLVGEETQAWLSIGISRGRS